MTYNSRARVARGFLTAGRGCIGGGITGFGPLSFRAAEAFSWGLRRMPFRAGFDRREGVSRIREPERTPMRKSLFDLMACALAFAAVQGASALTPPPSACQEWSPQWTAGTLSTSDPALTFTLAFVEAAESPWLDVEVLAAAVEPMAVPAGEEMPDCARAITVNFANKPPGNPVLRSRYRPGRELAGFYLRGGWDERWTAADG